MTPVYIYGLIDPRDETLRYIGKTNNPTARLHAHVSMSHLKDNSPRSIWMRQLLEQQAIPRMVIVEETDQDKWREAEHRQIAAARALGCPLTNSNAGRGGPTTWSAEARARSSAMRKGKPHSPAHRAALAVALAASAKQRVGKPLSAACKAKLSEKMKGRHLSPESIEKGAAKRRGRKMGPLTPETRAKMSAAHRGQPKSAEHRAKIGAAHKGKPLPPHHHARMREIALSRSPETRRKLGEAHRKLSPEQVMVIRQRARAGESGGSLALAYGLSQSSMSDIIARRSYKHLP